jgi:hypothetical protein
MSEWAKYMSHKVVHATPIVRIDGEARVLFVDPHGTGPELFEPTEPAMRQHCVVGDYAMRYRDGYRSVCPKAEFEDGYAPLLSA